VRQERRRVPLSRPVGRLGILGGSFDPIHNGHLICAEQIAEAVGLERVMFMPCSRSPHKLSRVPAPDNHRLAMIELAVTGHPGFEVSDLEIRRGGVSYTVDTVRQLRESLGREIELWLIMGMDAYLDIPTWKDPETVLAECRFAVARRPGSNAASLNAAYGARSCFVDITAVDISSSDIRDRLSKGKSIRYLVPEAVCEYIRTRKPYPGSGPAGARNAARQGG
jgi:nicotinate-nucleotide adenylyltransferase